MLGKTKRFFRKYWVVLLMLGMGITVAYGIIYVRLLVESVG
jgi:hypothetical protein